MAIGDRVYTATVGAAGTATVTISTGSRTRFWSLQQISIELASAPVGATANIRKNGVLISAMIPTGDAAGGDPPIPLNPQDSVTVNWAGCTPGTVGRVYVVFDEVSRL